MDTEIGVAKNGHSKHLFTVGETVLNNDPELITTFSDYAGSI